MGLPQPDMENTSNKRKRGGDEKSRSPLQQKRIKLLVSRKKLPIWLKQQEIRTALRDHDILVLSGETGSGKSTQVPQFLLDEAWCRSGKIAITQPRRVAAITLAKRVAEEMGTPLGNSSPASKVGYSVRFDESTSPSTRIKYLTEGMLLQEMLRDATIAQYSCVIIDEVHERSVNVDLLLGFLKNLAGTKRGSPLKVVVMSATADVDTLQHFFEDRGESDTSPAHQVALCHVEGRQFPVMTRYLDTPSDDLMEMALQRVFQIHCKEPLKPDTPGDMLVFMTGQERIQELQKLIEEFAQNLTADYPRVLVLPLFAALSQEAQQRIFQPAPKHTRKVILSTNIAETSVTVPGVCFVVDLGMAKVKQFRNRLGLDSLLVKRISKSSADQRKGRAGREGPGQCYRLYTEATQREMEDHDKPEILRCDLSAAILTMKARGADDVLGFPFLTPPSREAVEKALLNLWMLGTLEETGQISAVGRKVARLPLTPSLGRVIIEAARPEVNCLRDVIDIVACLSVESIWMTIDTEEVRERAQVARQQLARRSGDHLSLLAAVQAYAAEQTDRRRWADDHMISHRAMQSVMDVRKQLTAQCKQAKLLLPGDNHGEKSDEEGQNSILRCFLRGYSNKVALLCPDGSYKTVTGNQTVSIHPSSFLFGRKVEAIMYNEFLYTSKAYARGVSAVQRKWYDDIIVQ